jgi:hypothetical protein
VPVNDQAIKQWCIGQIKEIHGDFERLLNAKYNELKMMMPGDADNKGVAGQLR